LFKQIEQGNKRQTKIEDHFKNELKEIREDLKKLQGQLLSNETFDLASYEMKQIAPTKRNNLLSPVMTKLPNETP